GAGPGQPIGLHDRRLGQNARQSYEQQNEPSHQPPPTRTAACRSVYRVHLPRLATVAQSIWAWLFQDEWEVPGNPWVWPRPARVGVRKTRGYRDIPGVVWASSGLSDAAAGGAGGRGRVGLWR